MKYKLQVKNLNDYINDKDFISNLRALTLNKDSGSNKELTALQKMKDENGVIDAKAIIAHTPEGMIGWALFSRESSKCCFSYKFHSDQGVLIHIYVKPEARRSGAASAILKKARRLAGNKVLCVIPWSEEATKFYRKNSDLKLKSLLPWVDLSI